MSIFTLLVATIIGGAGGGLASYVLAGPLTKDNGESDSAGLNIKLAESYPWLVNLFLGVVAAFAVPLFLNLVQSELVQNILGDKTVAVARTSLLVYVGFCLAAGVSSKAFISFVAGRAFSALQNQVQENKVRLDKVEEIAENADTVGKPAVTEDAAPDHSESSNSAAHASARNVVLSLSEEELKVLHALQDTSFQRRTAAGVSRDSGLSRVATLRCLDRLIAVGLVTETKSKKTGNMLYESTRRGAVATTPPSQDRLS